MQVILKKTASIIVVLFPFLGFFQKQMVILGFHMGGLIIKVKGYFLAMYRGGPGHDDNSEKDSFHYSCAIPLFRLFSEANGDIGVSYGRVHNKVD